jgi:2-dehydro-3-deoxyphosphogluconate aldolase/(4S)-4-hydroxy-2-oxoglutarate aldolase
MKDQIIKSVYDQKIIAIVRGLSAEESFMTAQALARGGIRMIEVTFDQTALDGYCSTTDAIQRINQELGNQILAGAGTVMTTEQVDLAKKAGANYIITPNVNMGIIRYANQLGMVTMPGAMTPSEIQQAYEAGADFVKIFPAGALGASYVKAIKAPLKHVPILAVGGINENNLQEFLKAGVVGFGIGGNLVNRDWIQNKEFDKITELAKLYVNNL